FLLEIPLFSQPFTLITKGKIATDTTNTNGVSFVDYDADGDLDLFLTNANAPFGFNTLYRNEGNDQFTSVNAGEITGVQTASFGHAWGDYDNDGLPDLLIVNAFTQFGSVLYRNLGGGKFQRNENLDLGRNAVKGFNAAWADYDQDGFLDVVITHPAQFVGTPVTSNFLFKNDGNGYFSQNASTPITRPIAPFTNASWIDYDQDGDQDLFIGSGPANGTLAPDFIYQNQLKEKGKPEFIRLTQPSFAKDSLDGQVWNWIDYDNDGDLDAYVTNWGGSFGGLKNHLYQNNEGTFSKITEGDIVNDQGISLANVWADFDNDGDLDCFVGNGGNQPNRFYQNNGDGSFTTLAKGHLVESQKNTWGVTVGDYDNDGDQDLFVSNKTGYV
ncbi:MAG: VCBS repeat-containing protein, partial [Bacteroidetes bacterium]|nr:VCBS repeat-containing protein [Bacteroidota bacterium]